MSRYKFLLLFIFSLFTRNLIFSIDTGNTLASDFSLNNQDTLVENQILFNGSIWQNLYYKVKEDQFLFSKDFLPGSVTISGKTFNNIDIRFDIFKDEIMTPTNLGRILQLNKEMIDSFTIIFQKKIYQFAKIQEDTLRDFKGYFNVLYNKKSALYVKYKKEIFILAVEGKYDLFTQIQKIYFVPDSIVHLLSRKSEFFKLMGENKSQVKSFIKKNRLSISKRDPESFIPVIEYYDSLRQ